MHIILCLFNFTHNTLDLMMWKVVRSTNDKWSNCFEQKQLSSSNTKAELECDHRSRSVCYQSFQRVISYYSPISEKASTQRTFCEQNVSSQLHLQSPSPLKPGCMRIEIISYSFYCSAVRLLRYTSWRLPAHKFRSGHRWFSRMGSSVRVLDEEEIIPLTPSFIPPGPAFTQQMP